jgi:hypothetical protein
MPRCEVCENEYDKAFEISDARRAIGAHLRFVRMRHPCPGSDMSPPRVQDNRHGVEAGRFYCCQLRESCRRRRLRDRM